MKIETRPAEKILDYVDSLQLDEAEAVFELLNAAACLTPSPETFLDCCETMAKFLTKDN